MQDTSQSISHLDKVCYTFKMTTAIQFLHTMRQADHLEQALREGLMFTDHKVSFDPFNGLDDAAKKSAEYSLPKLLQRVTSCGANHLDLNDLAHGLGAMSGMVPMICFTEVQEGRNLTMHYLNFGAYGVVMTREWLERNGGDRVIYAGQNSALTTRLHRLFVDFLIAGVHVKNGKALFDSNHFHPILNLLAFIQGRDQLAEVEWRIAGEHGFMGGDKASGKRLPLPLNDIEDVVVQNDEDVPRFEAILRSLPGAGECTELPVVRRQPDSLRTMTSQYR